MAAHRPATTKKSTSKAAATPRATNKSKQVPSLQSFRLSRETERFISSRITRQTVYWLILSLSILVMGLLVLKVQLEILETLNQISENLY